MRVGDVVRLKSGGPRMVVLSLEGSRVVVRWGLNFDHFPKACVRIVGREELS